MGMFDHVRCDYPLPLYGINDRRYQTKDLSNTLKHYTIRKDGTLWFEKDKEWFFVDITQDINFYDIIGEKWIEFRVWFNHGKLVKLRYVGKSGRGRYN